MSRNQWHALFLIPSLQGGGAERVIVNLLRHLDRKKFQLTLVVLDTRGGLYREDLPEDVEVINLGCLRVRYAMPKIARLIWRRRPEIVLSTIGHLNLALAILRPFLPDGIRYVARESCIVSQVIRKYRRPSIWEWAYRRFYGRFDTVVCQSCDMRDDLIKNFGLEHSKLVVINNPVDVKRIRLLAAQSVETGFERKNKEDGTLVIHLLAVGRLVEQKGFDLLIEALAICRDSRLHLTLLGEGPMREELERLAHSRNVVRQVRFAGFQNNPYPFFEQADAFVLSSRFEGFPNVVLEALACGTPVIATPAPGGITEILNGVEECLVAESLTAKGLAKAFQHIPQKKKDFKAVVERYEVQKIVNRYEQKLISS